VLKPLLCIDKNAPTQLTSLGRGWVGKGLKLGRDWVGRLTR
jgi:hypothetical protein